MHSVSGVMCLDMWTGLIVMVFLTFTSCCLIRYAETRFLGGGGKQWKGGTVWIGTSAVLFRDTAHNWVGWVESLHISCISLGAVVECDVDGRDGGFDFKGRNGSGFKCSSYES